ncbi:MAG: CU044_2847 family protein, partial [Streptosporangiaceae bacterium]
SLDSALDQLRPALDVIRRRLEALAPDEVSVEFGIVLGAETGVVVAKGTTEVHFTISPEVGRRR